LRLSESEALHFLAEAGEGLELIDELFADHSLSAVTRMVRGTATDVVTRRPPDIPPEPRSYIQEI